MSMGHRRGRAAPPVALLRSRGEPRRAQDVSIQDGSGQDGPGRRAYCFVAASFMCLATTSGYAAYQSVAFTNLPPLTCQICTSPPPS